jgi:hypothetical protein
MVHRTAGRVAMENNMSDTLAPAKEQEGPVTLRRRPRRRHRRRGRHRSHHRLRRHRTGGAGAFLICRLVVTNGWPTICLKFNRLVASFSSSPSSRRRLVLVVASFSSSPSSRLCLVLVVPSCRRLVRVLGRTRLRRNPTGLALRVGAGPGD